MAKRDAKMKGFGWITPCLTVRSVEAALAFYENAFGFARGTAIPGPDGKLQHADMTYQGQTALMLGPEGGMGGTCKAPATSKVEPGFTLYVYCDDVDAQFRQAKAAGASVKSEPADMFWGDRMFTVHDPDGYSWSFAMNVADFDPAKVPQGK